MPNLEKKLLCFVQKHIAVLGIVCLLLVSAALRYFLLPYHSIDYVAALEVWYENFRSFGGWRALARDVGNYNMLYRTLMAAISYLPNPLVSINLVSILFDYIGAAAAALVLAVFIGLGILCDIIGVAVTAADPRPFHSMAAHKEPGAKEALVLLRNAGRVSSVCNDVVGDICGIVSGTTTAVIVVRLQTAFALPESVLLSVAVTALVSGLTIGGKALGKTVAVNKSTSVVYWGGRFLHLFHR